MNRAAQILVVEVPHRARGVRWRHGLPCVLPLVVLRSGRDSWHRCGYRWLDRSARRPWWWTGLEARRAMARERRESVRAAAGVRVDDRGGA